MSRARIDLTTTAPLDDFLAGAGLTQYALAGAAGQAAANVYSARRSAGGVRLATLVGLLDAAGYALVLTAVAKKSTG